MFSAISSGICPGRRMPPEPCVHLFHGKYQESSRNIGNLSCFVAILKNQNAIKIKTLLHFTTTKCLNLSSVLKFCIQNGAALFKYY